MPTMLDPSTTVRRNPRVAYRKLTEGAGGVLLHLDTAAYHGLNEIGALIWSLIEDDATLGGVVARLREQIPDAPPQLGDDVSSFLADLAERDLVFFGGADAAAGASG